jgi:hypothetical protein
MTRDDDIIGGYECTKLTSAAVHPERLITITLSHHEHQIHF